MFLLYFYEQISMQVTVLTVFRMTETPTSGTYDFP